MTSATHLYLSLVTKEFLPGFRQLRGFDFACDASFEFGMENRACSVNHDDIFRALGANRVRHARWNHHADVMSAAMMVAVDEESHHSPRQSCADVAQNHLNATLQKEHHIPLLVIVAAQRVVFRFIDEQAAQPLRRGAAFRNTGRMHMEAFSRDSKHARRRPLLRPETNPRENPFVAPHKLPEAPTMPLRVNSSRENFHARYPGFFDVALVLVGGH